MICAILTQILQSRYAYFSLQFHFDWKAGTAHFLLLGCVAGQGCTLWNIQVGPPSPPSNTIWKGSKLSPTYLPQFGSITGLHWEAGWRWLTFLSCCTEFDSIFPERNILFPFMPTAFKVVKCSKGGASRDLGMETLDHGWYYTGIDKAKRYQMHWYGAEKKSKYQIIAAYMFRMKMKRMERKKNHLAGVTS